jgi:hypothetical protein
MSDASRVSGCGLNFQIVRHGFIIGVIYEFAIWPSNFADSVADASPAASSRRATPSMTRKTSAFALVD